VIFWCRFLRKEKELAEARFEVLQTETMRLRQQTINLKKHADSVQKALSDEQETSQVCSGGILLFSGVYISS
jgi:hypothetical protein